jgi:hypothetical protein
MLTLMNVYFRYFRYFLGFRDTQDTRDFRDFRDFLGFRDTQDTRDFRDFRDFRDILNDKEIALTLCCLLTGDQTCHPTIILFTLYSLITANKQIRGELLLPVEQALQQFESSNSQQQASTKEQAYLVKAIRDYLQPEASTLPASQLTERTTAEARARELATFKQQEQLSRTDVVELLDACGDTRTIAEELWLKLMSAGYKNGQVGRLAWLQLSQPLKLNSEAWMALCDTLRHSEPLLCGAAMQIFQASNLIPAHVRRQATQVILDLLCDEKLSYRLLNTPDGSFLDIDDELFQTLQTLAEQDKKEV